MHLRRHARFYYVAFSSTAPSLASCWQGKNVRVAAKRRQTWSDDDVTLDHTQLCPQEDDNRMYGFTANRGPMFLGRLGPKILNLFYRLKVVHRMKQKCLEKKFSACNPPFKNVTCCSCKLPSLLPHFSTHLGSRYCDQGRQRDSDVAILEHLLSRFFFVFVFLFFFSC